MDEPSPDDDIASWLVQVRGLVQGVGYRDACVRHALEHGVRGWVRNRLDGTVEALLQGPVVRLERMIDWMGHEVPRALVDDVAVTPLSTDVPRLPSFERRPTE